jgi:hypothetical protein
MTWYSGGWNSEWSYLLALANWNVKKSLSKAIAKPDGYSHKQFRPESLKESLPPWRCQLERQLANRSELAKFASQSTAWLGVLVQETMGIQGELKSSRKRRPASLKRAEGG